MLLVGRDSNCHIDRDDDDKKYIDRDENGKKHMDKDMTITKNAEIGMWTMI